MSTITHLESATSIDGLHCICTNCPSHSTVDECRNARCIKCCLTAELVEKTYSRRNPYYGYGQ